MANASEEAQDEQIKAMVSLIQLTVAVHVVPMMATASVNRSHSH